MWLFLLELASLQANRWGPVEVELTALTLESSLQVLRRPFCRTSLCWTRFCTAAALEPFCSLSS